MEYLHDEYKIYKHTHTQGVKHAYNKCTNTSNLVKMFNINFTIKVPVAYGDMWFNFVLLQLYEI